MYVLVAIDLGESCKLGESYNFSKSCNNIILVNFGFIYGIYSIILVFV